VYGVTSKSWRRVGSLFRKKEKKMKTCIAGFGLIVASLNIACAGGSTSASPIPTASPRAITQMSFAINVPEVALVNEMNNQNPNGVKMSPVEAQSRWDYTSYYNGSPNVYLGEVGPAVQASYGGVGIVVAPYAIASRGTFNCSELSSTMYPDPKEVCEWVGHFAFAERGSSAVSQVPVAPGSTPIAFAKSGSGDTVFEIPTTVKKIAISGTSEKDSNFIVKVSGLLIVNVIVKTGKPFNGTYDTAGGKVEITSSTGVAWVFTEVK
jgi:hypothetical protein